jgi:hypothetical protein
MVEESRNKLLKAVDHNFIQCTTYPIPNTSTSTN